MHLGFTGTRKGMSSAQESSTRVLVSKLAPNAIHHGDAIGADAQMHVLAMEARVAIIIHPPLKAADRAFCESGELREPDSYARRNAHIVDESDMLVATPAGPEANARGAGTWRTVRLAMRQGKAVYVVWPDGSIEHRVPRKDVRITSRPS
jgi:hypothetical protein